VSEGEFYHFAIRDGNARARFRFERRDKERSLLSSGVDKILDWKSPQQYHVGGINKEASSMKRVCAANVR
jgi:hypothetical protein